MNNKTRLDLNDYPDIDLAEFSDWFENKFFKTVIINNDTDWFNGKYDVNIIIHRDFYHNKFSLELELVDVTDYPKDEHLEKMLKELEDDKLDGVIKK